MESSNHTLNFHKYSSAGNDFILFEGDYSLPVAKLCDRKRGIGADGVLFLLRKGPSHFQMRIINSDGNEAEMCGNGLRAIFRHLFDHYPKEAPFRVDSLQKTHQGWQSPAGKITIEMGNASFHEIKKSFLSLACDLIDTGVPHLVLERAPLKESFNHLAPLLRHHPDLPKGANVNLVEKIKDEWKVTTYERGVEEITDACGTGVTAAALSLALHEGLVPPITLATHGGDRLTVDWKGNPLSPQNLSLTGDVNLVFEGTLPSGYNSPFN